jgi:DNA polymerase I
MFNSSKLLGDRSKTITAIDASNLIFRAYHAIPPLSTSTGIQVNAVFGFTKILLKMLKTRNPSHIVMAFDKNSRESRLEIDPNYKATRAVASDDLGPQFEYIHRLLNAMNITALESSGNEADDVLATLSRRALAAGYEVEVISSDKDLIQLITPGVRLYDLAKEMYVDEDYVKNKYGIRPDQMRDYLSLVGDKIDNVAKVPGIGPKTAQKLLTQFNTLDVLVQNIDQIDKESVRSALTNNLSTLNTAKALVTLRDNLDLQIDFESLKRQAFNSTELQRLYNELEFKDIQDYN